nr:Chain P, Nrf2 EAGE mutant peptide [Homo sapiens]
LDEEAGEFL